MIRNRSTAFISLLVLLVGIVLLNIASSQFYHLFDLTEDNRYSLSEPTVKVLEDLEDVVYVEVFLEGDLPAGFKRLRSSVRETLEQFRTYGSENIQFRFKDPSADSDQKRRNETYRLLCARASAYQPDGGGEWQQDQKIIFPSAIVSFRGQELPVLLLKGNYAAPPDVRLNQSIEGMEYELISAIRKLGRSDKKKVAVITGHGKLSAEEMGGIVQELETSYTVERVRLQEKVFLSEYDAIIVAGPDTAFSEPDMFKIDQFIVKGGNALFFIDKIPVDIDSLSEKGTYAMPNSLNLDPLFFKYGIRINADLIQDLYSGSIPLFVGYEGSKPITNMVKWYFYPLLNMFNKHPISRNLDAIYAKFISSMDTVKAPGITKTPLLFTSKNSRILPAPVRVNFNMVRTDIKPELFRKGPLPVAWLLEGSFQSYFTGLLTPETMEKFEFEEQGNPGKVLIVSDADIIRNELGPRGTVYKTGYDRFTRQLYGNAEFIKNTLDYMLDEEGIIITRTKEVKLRPLDQVAINEQGMFWKVFNLAAPVLLVLLFGFGKWYLRRRRYAHFKIKE